MEIHGFDWDLGNKDKCQSHGVTLDDIEMLFSFPHVITPDAKHSDTEDRYLAIGRRRSDRPLFVVFTTRHDEERLLVRPISARYMHAKELKRYDR